MNRLSHLDETGAARMVDVSDKDVTEREAAAEAVITLSAEAYAAAVEGTGPKGDVLAAARIAGIMAAKKTSDLIPLCHPIAVTKAGIEFEPIGERHAIRILATVKTLGQTGVEMEALTAASVAALTIYDMVKAVDRGAVIESVRLVSKSGGKSGSYFATHREQATPKPRNPETLMSETGAPRATDVNAAREAFRAFMTAQRLRATVWAKDAGIPVQLLYAYLTGKSRALAPDVIKKLARAARVREQDMFRK